MSGNENTDNIRSRRIVNQDLSATMQGISVRRERIATILKQLGDTEGSERAAISVNNARLIAATSKSRQQTAEGKLADEGVPESQWGTKHRHAEK